MADLFEYHHERIQLHSGGKSHWLVRGDVLFENEELRESVLDCWERAVREYATQVGLHYSPRFYGIPEGGICWAKAIAARMQGVYLEKYVGGAFVVDDVCTTGASLGVYEHAPKLVAVLRVATGVPYVPVLASWMTVELDYAKEK